MADRASSDHASTALNRDLADFLASRPRPTLVHRHPCPGCFERPMCDDRRCSIDEDEDGGLPLGCFWLCDRCDKAGVHP